MTRFTGLIAASLVALALTGCSSTSVAPLSDGTGDLGGAVADEFANMLSTLDVRPEVKPGTEVTIESDSGEYTVIVERFVDSEDMNTNDVMAIDRMEGYRIGLLLMTVKNVSYDNPLLNWSGEERFIDMSPDVHVEDDNGVTMTTMGSSTDYGPYKGAAGGFLHCEEGQAIKTALFCQVPDGTDSAIAVVGNVKVNLKIEKAE